MPKAIVFDLFETLVSSPQKQGFFISLYRSSSTGYGMGVRRYLNLLLTSPLEALFSILPKSFYLDYMRKQESLLKELSAVCCYEEVHLVLFDLSLDYDLYLLSNLASPYKEVVSGLGLDVFFQKEFYSCDLRMRKPDARLFQEVEKQLGYESNEILMVGDSYASDVIGAKEAGWNYAQLCRKGIGGKDYQYLSLVKFRDALL